MFASVADTLWSLSEIRYHRWWGQSQVYHEGGDIPNSNAKYLLKNKRSYISELHRNKGHINHSLLKRTIHWSAVSLSNAVQTSDPKRDNQQMRPRLSHKPGGNLYAKGNLTLSIGILCCSTNIPQELCADFPSCNHLLVFISLSSLMLKGASVRIVQ